MERSKDKAAEEKKMGLFDYEYLRKEHIRGFDSYKYSSVDTSPVAIYVSHPLWNWIVEFYPKWLAPNVLTLAGGILVMASYAISSLLDPSLLASADSRPDHPPMPNILWLIFAMANLSAHILDGTDGKQARRTGASGPTGELFDHGIDSWLTLPFTVTLFAIFSSSPMDFSVSPLRLQLILHSVQLVFVVSHWEKYNTGVLFLPWGYDISQYALSTMYLLTYLGGYKMWKLHLFGGLTTPAEVAELIFYFSAFASVAVSVYNIGQAYKEGSLKQKSVWEGLRPLVPVLQLFAVSLAWALTTAVVARHFRLFVWSLGTIFSNIACRLIVAQMTGVRCEAGNGLLYILYGGAFLGYLFRGGLVETLLLWALALFTTAAHTHYAVCVVRQMTAHFGISAFSLDYLARKR